MNTQRLMWLTIGLLGLSPVVAVAQVAVAPDVVEEAPVTIPDAAVEVRSSPPENEAVLEPISAADDDPAPAAAPTPVAAVEVETQVVEMQAVEPAEHPVEPPEPADDNPRVAAPETALVPAGERALMDAHPVSTGIRFVPGKGLEISSDDGLFRLQIRTRVQFRYTLSNEDDELAHQFRIRRARIVFSGHAFDEDMRFKLELAVSPNDLGLRDNLSEDALAARPARTPLLDFYIDFRQWRDLQLRVGQYKVPSNRERVISSGNLQLVDRSILNSEFTLDRDIGFDIRSRDFLGLDMLRYHAGVYMARGRDSQGFDDFGMMYLGRVEVLPLGIFGDYSEADFERGDARLALGLGAAYIDRARGDRGIRGRRPVDGGTTDTAHVFVDAMFMGWGLSVLTEFAWRQGFRNPGDAVDEGGNVIPTADPRDGVGLNIQAGYLLPGLPLEVAARYAMVRGVGEDTAVSDSNELTVGLSYYAARHPYKLQLDYSRRWGEELSDGYHQVRLQLQLSL